MPSSPLDSIKTLWQDHRKRLFLMGALVAVALFAIVATIISTVSPSANKPSSLSHTDDSTNGTRPMKAPTLPTSSSGGNAPSPANMGILGGEVAVPPSVAPMPPPSPGAPPPTPAPTPPPNLVYVCTATDPTSVCYVPPRPAATTGAACALDTTMDPRLLYLACPAAANANAGFAMDAACASGSRCTYACEPPYVPTSNGWSNADCVPYSALCPPYSPATARGGLRCLNGQLTRDDPAQPLCVPGLNTSYVINYVPATLSTCQTVTPGNGAPMIGLEVGQGQAGQLTSLPQWYWRGVRASFYTNLPGVRRLAACQKNADPLSLNAKGVDTMPYVLGGGGLPSSGCDACGQHTLAFNDAFDVQKAYSKFPGYGIRVRNCNDATCGAVQCDATYTYDAASNTVAAVWVKYNTIFSPTSVGCVVDVVTGYGWSPSDGTSKFTLFEYYPTTVAGQQTPDCAGCSTPSTVDITSCRKIRQPTPASFGTGVSPAQYVCTPTGSAIAGAASLVVLAAAGDGTAADGGAAMSSATQVEIFIACVLAAAGVAVGVRVWRMRQTTTKQQHAMAEPPPCDLELTPDLRGSMYSTTSAKYIPRGSTAADLHDDDDNACDAPPSGSIAPTEAS
ncbi:Aste57867_3784 [Aphanomyces stellatus]|uniref:Aste57867_3784 protein n=1 Tax=Aphanomyces stellatus TaxID=120398 RepID=A0A485KCS2_9STRA|nr:hypothetical protein As57867_003773 [Aphanomyces stellatus]VFT80934.1 Aste57867_3784 [Aphanomyces stellatus]